MRLGIMAMTVSNPRYSVAEIRGDDKKTDKGDVGI